jgi:hypothetical protein
VVVERKADSIGIDSVAADDQKGGDSNPSARDIYAGQRLSQLSLAARNVILRVARGARVHLRLLRECQQIACLGYGTG